MSRAYTWLAAPIRRSAYCIADTVLPPRATIVNSVSVSTAMRNSRQPAPPAMPPSAPPPAPPDFAFSASSSARHASPSSGCPASADSCAIIAGRPSCAARRPPSEIHHDASPISTTPTTIEAPASRPKPRYTRESARPAIEPTYASGRGASSGEAILRPSTIEAISVRKSAATSSCADTFAITAPSRGRSMTMLAAGTPARSAANSPASSGR